MLKIISGTKKNTLIMQPPSSTRPTMQRIRKTIFDIIFQEIKDKIVIDCFAGSGAMGFEALSIGAKHAFFIESNKTAYNIIKNNAQKLKLEDKSTIIHANFFKYQSYLKKINKKIDIAFIDPPYGQFQEQEILKVLENLMPNGLAIFETNTTLELPETQILLQKQISDKYITFFKVYSA